MRICVDYHKLNAQTKKDPFSLPFLDWVLDLVVGHEMYSFMDGYNNYNQVKMAIEDKEKTTFILEWGAYAYNVMLFRLWNAIDTFQKIVSKAFKPYLNKFMQVFLDDFSVYGNKKDNLKEVQKCLKECRLNGISLNLDKCAFCANSEVLLWHIVCHDSLLVDPRKITAIINMLVPTILIEIKWFLGATSFYRHYFQDFASKTTPMCKLLKKDKELKWMDASTKSWECMKASMTCLLVLILPN